MNAVLSIINSISIVLPDVTTLVVVLGGKGYMMILQVLLLMM